MSISKTDCLESLSRAAELLGESPTKAQYENLGLTPASGTIIRVMGGWNAAKESAGLETYRSSGRRVNPKPDEVALPAGLNWEELSKYQRWHYRHPDWNTERTLRRRARLRSWANEIKRSRGCSRCDEESVACLDFHHSEGGSSNVTISTAITSGWSKKRLLSEIDKCTVLCSNCHRIEHYTPPSDPLRSRVEKMKLERGGCSNCTMEEPACLDFHHPDGVGTPVSRLVSDGFGWHQIRIEIERCIVLCSSCHRKEHYVPPQITGSDRV